MMQKRMCDNCRLKRRGECFGRNEVCDDYKYAPNITEEQAILWPKEMRYREEYHLPMRKMNYKSEPKELIKVSTTNNRRQEEKQIQLFVEKDIKFTSIAIYPSDLQQVLNEYVDSIILAVSPSCHIEQRKGAYSVALIYHKYKKVYCGQLYEITSSNRCALYGLIEGATHIIKPKDIVILTATCLGFKKAIKRKGVNEDLCNELFKILKQRGCQNITEIVVEGGGARVESICTVKC